MLEGMSNWMYQRFGSGSDLKHEYTSISDVDQLYGLESHDDNLLYSQSHPILSAAMLFLCNLFAQGKFAIMNRDGTPYTGEATSILRLLERPNYYQTRIDFLESAEWIKIARGHAVIYLKKTPGFKQPDAMYVLDPARIQYPKTFVTPMAFSPSDSRIANQEVTYMQTNDPKDWVKIKLSDLVYLYDLPNIVTPKNRFLTGSRIDGLHQTLDNTIDSLIAKNIILRTNGKEMLTSDGDSGFPLDGDDEENAKKLFNVGYGLSKTRNRSLVTRSSLRWQSMHIALRDLGLDESLKVDGNLIYTALHIPKDILSLEAKKTTYNNFRESMTSFIQNDIVSMMNDFTLSIGAALLPDNLELIGTYEHLPVMGFLHKEKAEATLTQAQALNAFLALGMETTQALELVGLDKTLNVKYEKPEPAGTQSTDSEANTKADARYLRKAE